MKNDELMNACLVHLLKLHLSTGFILLQEYFYTEMIPHLHWINVYVPLLWEALGAAGLFKVCKV